MNNLFPDDEFDHEINEFYDDEGRDAQNAHGIVGDEDDYWRVSALWQRGRSCGLGTPSLVGLSSRPREMAHWNRCVRQRTAGLDHARTPEVGSRWRLARRISPSCAR